MHSYFCDNLVDDVFALTNAEFHHLKNVIRLDIGEEIICVYNFEKYLCKIIEITNQTYFAKIIEKLFSNTSTLRVNLIVGLLREQKWDFVLQKATELGATCIVPVEFKRNVVKVDLKKEESKNARWFSICKSASEQSKRNEVPKLKPIVRNLKDLEKYKGDLNLVCWEEEKETLIKEQLKKSFTSISIVIGPEGGISKEEIEILTKLDFKTVSLGDNIMRAETVPIFVMSCLNYEKS